MLSEDRVLTQHVNHTSVVSLKHSLSLSYQCTLKKHLRFVTVCSPTDIIGRNVCNIVDVLFALQDELPSVLAKMAQKVRVLN